MLTLQQMAEGAEIDPVPAIRTLAKELYLMKTTGGPTMAQPQTDAIGNPLATLFNNRMANILLTAGFTTPDSIQATSDTDLLAVAGIDAKALKLIREKIG